MLDQIMSKSLNIESSFEKFSSLRTVDAKAICQLAEYNYKEVLFRFLECLGLVKTK